MKITFTNGRVVEREFHTRNVTGYSASKIEFTREDIEAMRRMAWERPETFQAVLANLQARLDHRVRKPR